MAHSLPSSFVGFSRQEHWSGLSCPPPEGLPDPGIKPTSLRSPALQADSLLTELRQKLFPAISINKGCHVHACDKSLQSCPILWDRMDCSPPGSSVQGTLQERIGSGLSCSPPGALPDPGIKPTSLMLPAMAGGFFIIRVTWEASWGWQGYQNAWGNLDEFIDRQMKNQGSF